MCGVVGAWSSRPTLLLEEIYLGLYALQHRGQEAAGVAWIDNEGSAQCLKGNGLVHQIFDHQHLGDTSCRAAIGHVRYSTTGGTGLVNAQPLAASSSAHGGFAVAHNGNLTNGDQLKQILENRGAIFQSRTDTEVLLHLMTHQAHKPFLDALTDALKRMRGAFSLTIIHQDRLIAARDPWGFRPLVLGKRDDIYYVASESCVFDLLGATLIRDIEPGEILIIDDSGLKSIQIPVVSKRRYRCAFEYVYFARPDSVIDGISVYHSRRSMGHELAKCNGCPKASLVSGLPDSGTIAALGYAAEAQIPYEAAIVRNRYSGRTFIEPTQRVRELGVLKKLNPIKSLLKSQELVVVDDSIVRGTTSRKVADLLRHCGASGVHFRVSSPPVCFPCYYGIDTPSREGLIAAQMNIDEIAPALGVDSLQYLSQEALVRSIGLPTNELCTACFDGHYMEEEHHDVLDL